MILHITAIIKNHTHIKLDSIIIKWINSWFVTHWLTIEQMIDRLQDWLNGESNLIFIPSQSDSIHSSFIAVIFQFSFIICMQWSIPVQCGKINILIQYQWLYCIVYLLINGFKMWILTKYLSIRTIPLCHYQIQSSWLFEAISLLSILNKS